MRGKAVAVEESVEQKTIWEGEVMGGCYSKAVYRIFIGSGKDRTGRTPTFRSSHMRSGVVVKIGVTRRFRTGKSVSLLSG